MPHPNQLTRWCVPCQGPRVMTRVLASAPVYSCDTCHNTKELSIEEKERIQSLHLPTPAQDNDEDRQTPRPKTTAAPRPKTASPSRKTTKEERTVPTPNPKTTTAAPSTMDQIVEAIVLRILDEKLPALVEKAVAQCSDKQNVTTELYPETLRRSLITMLKDSFLATPTGATDRADSACRHKNRMKKCPSCQAKGKK